MMNRFFMSTVVKPEGGGSSGGTGEPFLEFRDTFPHIDGRLANTAPYLWSAHRGVSASQYNANIANTSSGGDDPTVTSLNAGYTPGQENVWGVMIGSTSGHQDHLYHTTKHTISRTGQELHSIAYNFSHSNNTSHFNHAVIRIGSVWYRYSQNINNSRVITSNSMDGNVDSEYVRWVFDMETPGMWEQFDFQPGVVLSTPSPIAGLLPAGNITGFGIWVYHFSTSGRTHRFDNYEVFMH